MSQPTLLVLTALVFGALHAFGPDHLVAVGVFVSRRPSWRRALGLGARWGVGHSLTIVLVGGAVALSGLRLPHRFAPLAERAVGVVLIVLGALALLRARRLHAHWHVHEGGHHPHWHLHSHHHRAADDHAHDHRALLGIGMLHGLAGTGALVVAIPTAASASPLLAIVFLVCFGVGTVLSMSIVSAVAGHLLSVAGRGSARLTFRAAALAGVASVGVGLWWLVGGGA